MNQEEKTVPKKSYEKPALVVYGDIREITNAVANTSKNADGGVGVTNKTS